MAIGSLAAGCVRLRMTSTTVNPPREDPTSRVAPMTDPCESSSWRPRGGQSLLFRHVLCIYPYRRELNHAGFFPPLGLELIAAVLRPYTRAIDVIDLRKEHRHTRDFIRAETDLVCFSINWDIENDFIRDEILSVPSDILTMVGGRHATEDPRPWLSLCPNVNVVVRGDGEETIEELCRGAPLAEIPGISYRRNGRVEHNPNRQPQPVRDDVYPDRRLRRCAYPIHVENIPIPLTVDLVAASRGCPYNCTFCSFTLNPWGQKRRWSARSPESVVNELAEIDAAIVGFVDDLFTHDMDRVERICDLILQRGIRKKYVVNARLEIAKRPEVVRKMERAGFVMLLLGVESAHDKTLRSMNKGFDTARIRRYFRQLRDTSMILHAYFMLGNIGETVEEMRQIVPFARELGVDTIGISMLRNGRYTGLSDLVAQNPEYHVASNGKIYSDFCGPRDLRRLHRQLRRQFYTPKQLLRIGRKAARCDTMGLLGRLLPHLAPFALRLARQKYARFARKRKRRARELTGRTGAGSVEVAQSAG